MIIIRILIITRIRISIMMLIIIIPIIIVIVIIITKMIIIIIIRIINNNKNNKKCMIIIILIPGEVFLQSSCVSTLSTNLGLCFQCIGGGLGILSVGDS